MLGIIVLVSLVLGERTRTQAPIFKNGLIYYETAFVDEDGDVIFDYTYEDQKAVKIGAFPELFTNVSKNDTSFYVFPKEGFEKLKTNRKLLTTEKRCHTIKQSRDDGFFGLYTYTVLAVAKKEFVPSLTYVIKNGPIRKRFKNIPRILPPGETEEEFEPKIISQTCDGTGDKYLSYGLRQGGVVDSLCIPNSKVPSDVTKCADGSEISPQLVGYQEGAFKGDENTTKDLLIHFGPVLRFTQTGYELVIGWEREEEENRWVYVIEDDYGDYKIYTEPFSILEDTYYGGYVLINPDKAVDCNKPNIDTPKDICDCPEEETDQWNEDPRTEKGGVCSSGSIKATLSMIVAVLIIPVLGLFF